MEVDEQIATGNIDTSNLDLSQKQKPTETNGTKDLLFD